MWVWQNIKSYVGYKVDAQTKEEAINMVKDMTPDYFDYDPTYLDEYDVTDEDGNELC